MMKSYDIISDFRRWQKSHKNVMTPRIVSLKQKGNKIIEISSGRGIEHEPIFGVTIAERVSPYEFKTGDKRSELFYSLEEAKKYAERLKQVI
jgi:hypothetical protein